MGGGTPDSLAWLALRHAPTPEAILDGRSVVAASESLATVLAMPFDELVGTPVADLPLTPDGSLPLDTAIVGGGDHTVRLPDGRLSRLLARPLTADGHVLVQLVELTEDEQELRTTIKWLRDLVDNSTALMYIKSLDGRYLVANNYFARRFGISGDEVLGRTDHDMFPAEAADAYREHDLEVLTTGRSMEVEEPYAEVDAAGLPTGGSWLSIKFPLLDARGRPYALGAISTDITDRKRAEAAARLARDEAEQANRAKSEFLSRMSHELRTPLNAIIGFAQLLRMERLEPTAVESVEHILDAGQHLLLLVNEVLDLTWIEAGAPGLDVVQVHACEPLQEALELMRPLAHERDVELSSDLHQALYRYVRADPHRLKQVFLNLLSNAIKFNRPAGAVRVRCAVDGGRIRFLVTDTGAGIDEADLGRLFAPFVRLSPQQETEGSGLGLALSRRLVEEMGGEVGIQHSAPGDGSTFYVDLPLTDTPTERRELPVRAADGLSRPGPRALVLYIEDTHANLRLVENIVSRMGDLELVTATRGELGLQLAAQHQPALILLDLHLADIAGEDVLRRLAADERTSAIPVIVVSADATPARILQLERAGIADYLTKPLDVHNFARAVRKVLTPS